MNRILALLILIMPSWTYVANPKNQIREKGLASAKSSPPLSYGGMYSLYLVHGVPVLRRQPQSTAPWPGTFSQLLLEEAEFRIDLAAFPFIQRAAAESRAVKKLDDTQRQFRQCGQSRPCLE